MEKMMEKVQIVQPIIKNEGSAGIKKELKNIHMGESEKLFLTYITLYVTDRFSYFFSCFCEMISIYLPDKNHISLQFVIILSFLKWNHLLEENP